MIPVVVCSSPISHSIKTRPLAIKNSKGLFISADFSQMQIRQVGLLAGSDRVGLLLPLVKLTGCWFAAAYIRLADKSDGETAMGVT